MQQDAATQVEKGHKRDKENAETGSAYEENVVNCRVDIGKTRAFVSLAPSAGSIDHRLEARCWGKTPPK